ncbi:MAG: VOC family protein [Fimbriimonas sp.]
MVSGFHTIWAPVSDMERSVKFYQAILGRAPLVNSPHWSEFEVGANKIGLHPGTQGEKPVGGWMLTLEVESVVRFHLLVAKAGGSIDGDYHQTPSGVVLTFADPDGNPIQAMQVGATLDDLVF